MAQTATLSSKFEAPLGEMNTTPLIDVMLVLLVMFILAVPVAVHQLPFDLPTSSNQPVKMPIGPQNDLTIDADGQPAWNGSILSEAELFAVLNRATLIKPEPLVRFTPASAAPYSASARVLRLIKLSGVTSFAFVGNEQYAAFGKTAAARTAR